jgi:hypothetical protein
MRDGSVIAKGLVCSVVNPLSVTNEMDRLGSPARRKKWDTQGNVCEVREIKENQIVLALTAFTSTTFARANSRLREQRESMLRYVRIRLFVLAKRRQCRFPRWKEAHFLAVVRDVKFKCCR